MIRQSVAVLAAVAAATLAACGGGGSHTTADTGTTEAAPPAATAPGTTTNEDGVDPMAGASTRPVHVPATNKQTALLTDVRAARHEGFDRVVFEFRNVLPGFDVGYASRPIHQDASGKVVAIAGNHVVRVRMENALDADLSQSTAPATYTGPERLRPATSELLDLARVGGFEAVLTWAAGLQERVDFRVRTLTAPPRLVVDFRNR